MILENMRGKEETVHLQSNRCLRMEIDLGFGKNSSKLQR